MADLKISQLTGATTPLAGTEVLPIVQSGSTKKVSVANLTTNRAVAGASFTANTLLAGDVLGLGTTSPVGVVSTKIIDVIAGTNGNSQMVLEGNSGGQFVTLLSGTDASNLPSLFFNNGLRISLATSKDATGYAEIGRWETTGFIPVAGKGINFTANTPAAGMTSQLLNWYEEGTWTPTLTASGSNPTVTYTVQTGNYTRIGRQITASFILQYSALSGGSGTVRFSLPFAGGASECKGGPLYVYGVTPPANTYSMCLEDVINGTSYVGGIFSISGGAFVSLDISHLPAGTGSFRGQITYFA